MTTKTTRGQFELSDIMKILLMSLLVASSFLAGVLTANHQTGNIVSDIEKEVRATEDLLLEEIDDHRDRDKIHICLTGLGQLRMQLILRNLAKDAGLPYKQIPTMLRKEVVEICAETDIQNGRHP